MVESRSIFENRTASPWKCSCFRSTRHPLPVAPPLFPFLPLSYAKPSLGHDSIKSFREVLETTQTIAKKLAEVTEKGVTTIIGGDDSVAAVEKVGLADKMNYIFLLEAVHDWSCWRVKCLQESLPLTSCVSRSPHFFSVILRFSTSFSSTLAAICMIF